MTGHLTTHVLDTMHGRPAGGMAVTLHRLNDPADALQPAVVLGQWRLNADGRVDTPLLQGADFLPGRYRLLFDVSGYFKACGVALPDPPFLDAVPIDFGIADTRQRYHVPLLASPWSFSTYRGS